LSKVIEKDLADDTLDGIEEIAAFIGCSIRSAYWRCEQKHIPAFKHVGKWHLRKSTYRNFIAKLEVEAAA
jgi:hypothetical protein